MFGNQRELLQSFLQEYFQNAGPIVAAHNLLQQIPFCSIITTNYDRLLEEAYPEYAKEGVFTPKEAEPLLNVVLQNARSYSLYGLIERLETLIFAPIEYREALSSNISFSKFMEAISSPERFSSSAWDSKEFRISYRALYFAESAPVSISRWSRSADRHGKRRPNYFSGATTSK